MTQYREMHKVATWALDEAKENAKAYSLPEGTILFKKIDKNGKISVGFKPFGEGQFRLIKRKEVEAMGIDINSLPEYTQFSEEYQRLHSKLQRFFNDTRTQAYNEIRRCKDEYLRPFYRRRREVYDSYMSSMEWAIKRKEVFDAQGTSCIDCGVSATDIHHLHYETLGDECPVKDLVPLCSICHSARHNMDHIEP